MRSARADTAMTMSSGGEIRGLLSANGDRRMKGKKRRRRTAATGGHGMQKVIEITDFSAPELDAYARISENQLLNRHEPEKGMFIAESPKVIERALEAGYQPVSFLVETRHLETQARELLCRCPEVPVYTAALDVLTRLTGFRLTRGMLCAMRRKPLPAVEEICAGARRIAVLENIVNPTNIGAVFRSAAALNVGAVLLTGACSNPLYRRAVRVSMGTVFQVPWTVFSRKTPDGRRKEWNVCIVWAFGRRLWRCARIPYGWTIRS